MIIERWMKCRWLKLDNNNEKGRIKKEMKFELKK